MSSPWITRQATWWGTGAGWPSCANLAILDTPAEMAYDDIARLATACCQSPIAAVNFVDDERHWTKSIVGVAGGQGTSVSADISFCAATIATDGGLLSLSDTSESERWCSHPLVEGPPFVGFYAGAAIVVSGQPIGVVCVVGSEPRELGEREEMALVALARQASAHLELRKHDADLRTLAVRLARRVVVGACRPGAVAKGRPPPATRRSRKRASVGTPASRKAARCRICAPAGIYCADLARGITDQVLRGELAARFDPGRWGFGEHIGDRGLWQTRRRLRPERRCQELHQRHATDGRQWSARQRQHDGSVRRLDTSGSRGAVQLEIAALAASSAQPSAGTRRRALMVRKGSPVRVRKRAWRSSRGVPPAD